MASSHDCEFILLNSSALKISHSLNVFCLLQAISLNLILVGVVIVSDTGFRVGSDTGFRVGSGTGVSFAIVVNGRNPVLFGFTTSVSVFARGTAGVLVFILAGTLGIFFFAFGITTGSVDFCMFLRHAFDATVVPRCSNDFRTFATHSAVVSLSSLSKKGAASADHPIFIAACFLHGTSPSLFKLVRVSVKAPEKSDGLMEISHFELGTFHFNAPINGSIAAHTSTKFVASSSDIPDATSHSLILFNGIDGEVSTSAIDPHVSHCRDIAHIAQDTGAKIV